MEAVVFFSGGISEWILQLTLNRNVSIKAGEREIRRRNDKVIIKSTNSKVPKDFQAFLRKGENKNRLTDLLCGTVSSSSNRALPILPTSVIYFSKEDSCVRVNASQVTAVNELSSNQEEADTMVLLHSAHAISTAEGSIILRSSSGDIDIMIMAISLIKRVLVDYGNGKNRKGVWLNSMDLDDNIRAALIGFHVFTGNDYVSSFFKHDKQGCFKVMKQCDKFINALRLLGENWELNAELIVAMESFVCHLYGHKDTDINKIR